MAEDREQAIEDIIQRARQVRARTPRWLWIVAGVLGGGCAIAFVVLLVGAGDATAPQAGAPVPVPVAGGSGFGAGLALGVGVGIVIGFAIARQLVRDHSSRSKP